MVVDAVYARGGRFLDAEGRDVGWKKSMDKAMKALKDRRHIKARKTGVSTPIDSGKGPKMSPSGTKSAHKPASTSRPPAFDVNQASKPKNSITTDDAGYALMLLKNAREQARKENLKRSALMPPEARKYVEEERIRPAKKIRGESGHHYSFADNNSARYGEPSEDLESSAFTLGMVPPESFGRDHPVAPPRPGEAEQDVENKGELTYIAQQGDVPLLWQSVIVSRESPQASLADMLVNAKQRLHALSAVQQAVSAPICLIYPPSPHFTWQNHISLQEFFRDGGRNPPVIG